MIERSPVTEWRRFSGPETSKATSSEQKDREWEENKSREEGKSSLSWTVASNIGHHLPSVVWRGARAGSVHSERDSRSTARDEGEQPIAWRGGGQEVLLNAWPRGQKKKELDSVREKERPRGRARRGLCGVVPIGGRAQWYLSLGPRLRHRFRVDRGRLHILPN